VVADLTLASREYARLKQTDADVASFDGGSGRARRCDALARAYVG
jgi:naphthoate synthase